MTAILLSGGLDSAAIGWWKRPDISIFVDYGQKPAKGEREAAKKISKLISSEFIEVSVDCSSIGSGCLAASEPLKEAPSIEWWPYRNQLLITLAAPIALKKNVKKIIFGSVKTDHFHKDGTSNFFNIFNNLMTYQEGEIAIEAPAVNMRCEDLIKFAEVPREIISVSHSCHRFNMACGICEGCKKHYAILDILNLEY